MEGGESNLEIFVGGMLTFRIVQLCYFCVLSFA
jgi:hypothetical protein